MSTAEANAGTRDQERPALGDFPWRRPFPTRWHDNDVFGHLNNTVYYAAMDTTVTTWLLTEARHGLAPDAEPAVVVASSCRYFASAAFPDALVVGLRADRIGTTSVSWGLGIFREGPQDGGALLATGTFVHVFVGAEDRRPVPVPDPLAQRVRAELLR